MQHLSTESEIIKICCKAATEAWPIMGPKYKDYLYLDEFRYSGIYEVTYYESKEVGVKIWIRNRQNSPKGPRGLAEKLIVRLVES